MPSLRDPKDCIKQAKMTSEKNIPLPPSKGELYPKVPPLKGAGGCFFLFVIGSNPGGASNQVWIASSFLLAMTLHLFLRFTVDITLIS